MQHGKNWYTQPAYDIIKHNIIRLWCIFLAQHKLVKNVNVSVSARCFWPTDAGFTLCQSSVSVALNKKLHYCEEHSASIVLGWCTLTFLGRESLGG